MTDFPVEIQIETLGLQGPSGDGISQDQVDAIYLAIEGRSPVGHKHPALDIEDSTPAGRALITAADAAAQKALLALDLAENTTDLGKPVSIATRVLINQAETAFLQTQDRPGDAAEKYGATLTGRAGDTAPAEGAIVVEASGDAFEIGGGGILATRERIALVPGRLYSVEFELRRAVDPSDLVDGGPVTLGIQWLDNNKEDIGQEIVESFEPLIADDGVQSISVIVAQAAGDDVDIVWPGAWPSDAKYMVPFVQTEGEDGQTRVRVLGWRDATGAVLSGDISGVVAGLQAADASEAQTRGDADAAEAQARADADTALAADIAGRALLVHTHTPSQVGLGNVANISPEDMIVSTAQAAAIARAETAFLQTQYRPGDAFERYGGSLTGQAADTLPLDGVVTTDSTGDAFRLTGAALLAIRERVALIAGHLYYVDFDLRRSVDPTIASNVKLAIQWLNSDKIALSQTIVRGFEPLTVADGVKIVTKVIGEAAGSGIDIVWPGTAKYMVVFVQTEGDDGVTLVRALGWRDATGSAPLAGDIGYIVSTLQAADATEAAVRAEADSALGIKRLDQFAAGPDRQHNGAFLTPSGKSPFWFGPKGEAKIAKIAFQNQLPDPLDWPYVGGIFGKLGKLKKVLLGILPDGRIKMVRHNEQRIDTSAVDLQSEFVHAWTDKRKKRVPLGIRPEGTTFALLDRKSIDYIGQNLGAGAGATVSPDAIPDGLLEGTVTGGATSGPSLVRFWRTADDGDRRSYLMSNVAAPKVAIEENANPIFWIPLGGESLAVGSQGKPSRETMPVAPNTGLMLSSGLRGVAAALFDPEIVTDFVPAYEVDDPLTDAGSTGGAAMLQWLESAQATRGDARNVYIFRSHGQAGQTYSVIEEGGTYEITNPSPPPPTLTVSSNVFENGIDEPAHARKIAHQRYGREVICPAVFQCMGVNDRADGTSAAAAKAFIFDFQADYDRRYKAALNQPAITVPLFIDQLVAPRSGAAGVDTVDNIAGPIAQAQLEAALESANIYLVCTKYFLDQPTTQNVHLSALGYDVLGEYRAKALDRYLRHGATRFCPMPRVGSISVVGSLVTISYDLVQVPGLTTEWFGLQFATTSYLGAKVNQGYALEAATAAGRTISSVAIIDDGAATGLGKVGITLSSAPAAGTIMQYAYQADPADTTLAHSAAWGNLCDTDTAASITNPGRGPLYNFAPVLRKAIA